MSVKYRLRKSIGKKVLSKTGHLCLFEWNVNDYLTGSQAMSREVHVFRSNRQMSSKYAKLHGFQGKRRNRTQSCNFALSKPFLPSDRLVWVKLFMKH